MIRLRSIHAILFILLAAPCFAADSSLLPDKPQAQEKTRTADREFFLDSSALAVGWTLDTVSTAQRFDWCDAHYGTRTGYQPDCFENGGFFNNTRDTGKIMVAWAAVDVAAVISSYEWKKHVHNRWLHPLWRVPLLVGAAGHSRSAVGNWTSKR